MTGSEFGSNEGEIEYGDWDYEMEQESAGEARARMSEEEILDDQRYELLRGGELGGDPFAEQAP